MGQDNKTTVVLDLDNKDFVKKLKESLGLLGDIGGSGSESISNLSSTFMKVGAVAGIAAAAFYAVKTALDLTKEAEHVRQVSNSFEALASSAGLAGDEIREGLVGAAQGLADDTDILQAANRAIVEMGGNARRIPETMELARKATVLFGGDLIENFEGMNRALANGNERQLRQYGIVIDSKKAIEDYAKSVGVGAQYLTEAAKKQAVMNAAMDEAKKKYASVDESALASTNNIKKLSVTFNELREAVALAFEKLAGPTVQKITEAVSYAAGYWAKSIKNALGIETETAHQAHQENLKKEIALQEQAGAAAKNAGPQIDYEKLKQNRNKFERELEEIRMKRVESDLEFAGTEEQATLAFNERKISMERQAQLEIDQIKKQASDLGLLNSAETTAAIANVNTTLQNQLLDNERELQEARINALNNYQNRATTAAEGISAAFRKGSAQSAIDLTNWGKTGQMMFDSVKNRSVSAFKAMGDGSKSASQAMRGFMFGAIGDTATAKGTEMLLSGIWPPNPIAIAGGGALIALGSALSAQGEGGGGGVPTGGGVGGGGGGGSGDALTDAKPEPQQQERKSVSVNIHGNLYETDQTRTRLMDMIREAGDFTDFNISKIGQ